MNKPTKSEYKPQTEAQRRKMVRFLIDSGQQGEFSFCRDPQPSVDTDAPKNARRKRKRGEYPD